jgi:hypothetical protein
MTYSSDWRLSGGQEALSARVYEYVWDTLLTNSGVSLIEWDRCGEKYQETVQSMSEVWGSMVSDEGVTIRIPKTKRTLADRKAFIRDLFRADSRDQNVRRVYAKAREAAAQRQKRIFVVFLSSFWWKYAGENARVTEDMQVGHSQFIILDLRNKKQVFFDPHGTRAHNFFKELCAVDAMVPGHTNVPPQEALGEVLQSHMEGELDAEQRGTCGLTSILTVLCARRLNYWHMPRLTRAIIAAFPLRRQTAVVIQGLVHLYETKILRLNLKPGELTDEQVTGILSALFPDQPRCSVYSERTGKFCGRAACRAGPLLTLCWQHRHILQSPQVESRKCTAPPR